MLRNIFQSAAKYHVRQSARDLQEHVKLCPLHKRRGEVSTGRMRTKWKAWRDWEKRSGDKRPLNQICPRALSTMWRQWYRIPDQLMTTLTCNIITRTSTVLETNGV